MNLDKVDISKLPADVRKTYRRYQVMHAEKKIQNRAKDDFLSFVKCVWPDFIEGAHHRHIAKKFNKISTGEIKRLIINMPPRHTKSEFASYLLPSWMVGRNPKLKSKLKILSWKINVCWSDGAEEDLSDCDDDTASAVDQWLTEVEEERNNESTK